MRIPIYYAIVILMVMKSQVSMGMAELRNQIKSRPYAALWLGLSAAGAVKEYAYSTKCRLISGRIALCDSVCDVLDMHKNDANNQDLLVSHVPFLVKEDGEKPENHKKRVLDLLGVEDNAQWRFSIHHLLHYDQIRYNRAAIRVQLFDQLKIHRESLQVQLEIEQEKLLQNSIFNSSIIGGLCGLLALFRQ